MCLQAILPIARTFSEYLITNHWFSNQTDRLNEWWQWNYAEIQDFANLTIEFHFHFHITYPHDHVLCIHFKNVTCWCTMCAMVCFLSVNIIAEICWKQINPFRCDPMPRQPFSLYKRWKSHLHTAFISIYWRPSKVKCLYKRLSLRKYWPIVDNMLLC